MKKLDHKVKYALIGIFVWLCLQAVLVPFISEPIAYLDIAIMLFILALVSFIAKDRELPLYAIIGSAIPFVMHSLGVMGAYAGFSYIFTFDKWMHFLGGIGVTLFILGMLKHLPLWERMLIAFLAAMGLGAITECMEFIGHFYFGIEQGGIFTFGDGQPLTGSVLQTYDTYFDMIFQMAGNIVALLFSLAERKVR